VTTTLYFLLTRSLRLQRKKAAEEKEEKERELKWGALAMEKKLQNAKKELSNSKKSKREASTATKKNDSSMVYFDDVIFKITPDKLYKMKGANKLPEALEHIYLVAPDKPLPCSTEWGNHDAVFVYCTLCNKVIQYKGRVMWNVVNHWNTTPKASVTSQPFASLVAPNPTMMNNTSQQQQMMMQVPMMQRTMQQPMQ
jgi:hypothetical protein